MIYQQLIDKIETKVKLKNGENIKLYLWDTAGQERFRSIDFGPVRNSDGVIINFSLNNKVSFENASKWLLSIKEIKDCPIYLFGCKSDLRKEEREVNEEEIAQFLKNKNMRYYETSAKLGINVKEGIEAIANDAYDFWEGKFNENNNFTKKIYTNSKNNKAQTTNKNIINQKKNIKKEYLKFNTLNKFINY